MNENPVEPRLRQLETLLLIRAYEEQLVELQRNGAPGTCTSVGQEACAVGVIDALERATASSPTTAARRTCWRAAPIPGG
jgi:TPP-dependent pyruvate/acetoin dehydrogenase alpha subunit